MSEVNIVKSKYNRNPGIYEVILQKQDESRGLEMLDLTLENRYTLLKVGFVVQGNSSAQRSESVREALLHFTNIAVSVVDSSSLLPEREPQIGSE